MAYIITNKIRAGGIPQGNTNVEGYAAFTFETKAYISLERTQAVMDKLKEASNWPTVERKYPNLGDPNFILKLLDGFWELILTSYSERHMDSAEIKNVLADTYSAFSMGELPIQINLAGYLATYPTMDHRIDFLQLYDIYFRGTQQKRHGLLVDLQVKDTFMRFKPLNLSYGYSSHLSDFTQFSMSGIGYHYQVPTLVKTGKAG